LYAIQLRFFESLPPFRVNFKFFETDLSLIVWIELGQGTNLKLPSIWEPLQKQPAFYLSLSSHVRPLDSSESRLEIQRVSPQTNYDLLSTKF